MDELDKVIDNLHRIRVAIEMEPHGLHGWWYEAAGSIGIAIEVLKEIKEGQTAQERKTDDKG